MAWEQVLISGMNCTLLTESALNNVISKLRIVNGSGSDAQSIYQIQNTNIVETSGDSYTNNTSGELIDLVSDSDILIQYSATSIYLGYRVTLLQQGNYTAQPTPSYSAGNPIVYNGLVALINRETSQGTFVQVIQNGYGYRIVFQVFANMNVMLTVYNWIIAHPAQPPYNWQSVPSISGKNGILSLVTLDSEAINDGEPVSGAAISVFDQAPSTDNNAKDLADTYGSGEESSAVDVTVKYKVTLPPGGSFSVLKLVAKKDSIPEDATDGDKIVDISPTKTKKTVTGLDENSMYYFKIFAEDSNSNTSESDEKHILTSGDEGYNFDYTGEIVEWTVPKTGIYQLETWGAQGGNATDGTLTARGGYGAYAVGEVFLTQGDTLYINVGGQNGYGGGGNYTPPNE